MKYIRTGNPPTLQRAYPVIKSRDTNSVSPPPPIDIELLTPYEQIVGGFVDLREHEVLAANTPNTFAANSLSATLTNGPGTITSGSEGLRFNTAKPVFTTETARDMIVEGYASQGEVALRVHPVDPANPLVVQGLMLSHNSSGSGFHVNFSYKEYTLNSEGSIVSSRTIRFSAPGWMNFHNGGNTSLFVPGYSSDPSARALHKFRVTCIVHNLKLEFSTNGGLTWATCFDGPFAADYLTPGKVMWAGNWKSYEATLATENPRLYSDLGGPLMGPGESYLSGIFDLRDLGLKDTVATGSMGAASNTLVLTSANHKFKVGDPIVVQVGGEAGEGLRGARDGVGGAFPTASVATTANLPAFDTPQQLPTFSRIHVQEDNLVYITWNDSRDWEPMSDYYDRMPMPRSLKARVTAVNGSSLTLDTPSVNATNGAKVVYDCHRSGIVEFVKTNANRTLKIPALQFHFSAPITTLQGINSKILGQGRWSSELRGIDGCDAFGLTATNINNSEFKNFAVIGTYRLDSGFLQSSGKRGIDITAINTLIEDCRFVDLPNAIVGGYCTNSIIRRCDAYKNGTASYVQWEFQFADAGNNLIEDCKLISDFLTNGPEAFRSHGTKIRRCGGVNMVTANNSSADSPYTDIHTYITTGSLHGYDQNFHFNPVHNFNDNLNSLPNNTSAVLAKNIVTVYEGSIKDPERTYAATAGQTLGLNINVGPGERWVGEIDDCLLWVPESMRSLNTASAGMTFEAGGTLPRGTIQNSRSYPIRDASHPGGAIAVTRGGPNLVENCQGSAQVATGGAVTGQQTIQEWLDSRSSESPPVVDFRITENIDGTIDCWAYDINEAKDEMIHLAYSPWGKIIKYQWEFINGIGQVVKTDHTWWGSSGKLPPGTITVRLKVWDELEQMAQREKTFTGFGTDNLVAQPDNLLLSSSGQTFTTSDGFILTSSDPE